MIDKDDKDEAKGAASSAAASATAIARIKLNLHPDFVSWINRESARIATLVEDLTDIARSYRSLRPHPDLAVKQFVGPRDIIGEPIVSITEAGKLVARFYSHQDRFLGLRNGAIADAQKIAERIWSTRELCDLLSRTSILDLLLDYVGTIARGIPSDTLADRIVQTVNERVRPLSVWVPIEGVVVEGEFRFATAVLNQLSRAELEVAFNSSGFPMSTDEARRLPENLNSKWSGRTVMRFEFVAEPKRAGELATEWATNYMNLLQFYTAPTMILHVVSHAAPSGAHPYRTQEYVVSASNVFQLSEGITESYTSLHID